MARNALDEMTCFPNIIRVENILKLIGFLKISLQRRMDTCCLLATFISQKFMRNKAINTLKIIGTFIH